MKVGKCSLAWLGHSSFVISWGTGDEERRLYIDPYDIGMARPDAHYVLITHTHYDHLSVEDLDRICTEDTQIICTRDCFDKVHDLPGKKQYVMPGDEIDMDEFVVTATPAYNTNKKFHPKENNWVGYIIEILGKRIYHLGDTDNIKELKGVECDVALIPISGTYVMDAKEAVKATKALKAKKAVPCHWGSFIGTDTDAQFFKKNAHCTVTIMSRE